MLLNSNQSNITTSLNLTGVRSRAAALNLFLAKMRTGVFNSQSTSVHPICRRGSRRAPAVSACRSCATLVPIR